MNFKLMLIWRQNQPIRIGLFETVPEHWYSECLRACSLLWNRIPFFAKHLGIKTSNSSHSNLPSLNKYFISKGPYGDDPGWSRPKLKRIPRKGTIMAQSHCKGHLRSLTEAFWIKTWPDLRYCQEMGERCISAEAVETSESHLLPFHLPFITKLIIIFLIFFRV